MSTASSYDFVVVWAGTAELTLAAPLSESGKFSVVVIEAAVNSQGDPIIDMPGYFGADVGAIYD